MKFLSRLIKSKSTGNNRGITFVYIAILLIVLLAFVGLVIDMGYMYVAKTQLQNAADAAALAGAAELLEKSKDPNQPIVRNAAWTIACKNKVAGGAKVFLISAANDCNSPPNDLNNTANNPDGDIVLGHWDKTDGFTAVSPSSTSSDFINAVKVVARRTSEQSISNVRIGNNPISLFFGRIFALLPGAGTGWPLMSVSADAIAVRNNPPLVNLVLCATDCGYTTTLSVVSPNITRGTRFHTKGSTTPLIGWTTFTDNDTSTTNINNYLSGVKQTPDFCELPYPTCLFTTNGVTNPTLCTLRGMVKEQSSEYVVNGVTVKGMKVFIPIVDSFNNPCQHKGTACVSDPTYQPGDAFPFTKYATAIITDTVPEGNCPKVIAPQVGGTPGIVLVGTGAASTGFSTIECVNCPNTEGVFIKTSRLVE